MICRHIRHHDQSLRYALGSGKFASVDGVLGLSPVTGNYEMCDKGFLPEVKPPKGKEHSKAKRKKKSEDTELD
jgi:hypothetical protein